MIFVLYVEGYSKMRFVRISHKGVTKIKAIITISFTFITTIIFPYIFYLYNKGLAFEEGVNIYKYLLRVKQITIISVIIGGFITGLVVFMFLQRAYSNYRYILSTVSLIIFCLFIIIWSNVISINISVDIITISISLSILYIFTLGIPILVIFRNTYNFIIKKKEIKNYLLILRAIQESGNFSSKIQIRKHISNNVLIDYKFKDFLLKNLTNLLEELEFEKKLISSKNRKYILSKKGKELLKIYGDLMPDFMKEESVMELEVWSEEELQKYAHRRKNGRIK